MTYFKNTFLLTDSEKRKVAEMTGNIIMWILNGESIGYMSDKLNMPPHEIEHNIEETLYTLRKHVGRWRYIKMLFVK